MIMAIGVGVIIFLVMFVMGILRDEAIYKAKQEMRKEMKAYVADHVATMEDIIEHRVIDAITANAVTCESGDDPNKA